MKLKLISRSITALILGIVLAVGIHHRMDARSRAGRESFMAEQSRRWDANYTRPHDLPPAIIMGVGVAVVVFGFYELTSAALCWALTRACGPRQ